MPARRPPGAASRSRGAEAPAEAPSFALPVRPPLDPMLAAAVDDVPAADAVEGGYWYEPKWDGFRCIVFYDGAASGDDAAAGQPQVELGSRGGKSLTRYFPEVVAELRRQLGATRCVLDGEVVVRSGRPGAERLDWDALTQRVHPAASRVRRLAEETPASFVAFDLLASGDDTLLDQPFALRRSRLEDLLGDVEPPLHLTQGTQDDAVARGWLADFEGAGLDGVVAKPRMAPYTPGKRVMRKIKHARTADVVVVGYRVHKSGRGVGSLLLGLRDTAPDGPGSPEPTYHQVGGASAFTDARRLELVEELDPYVVRDDDGEPVRGAGERSRFSASKDTSFVVVRPERVCEVGYDQLENGRFRHVVRFLRWRPDRDPASCTLEQLDVPAAYDLDTVLAGRR